MKKYNMSNILRRAWEIRRERNATMSTALKLEWGEAKGVKLYTTHLIETERAADCGAGARIAEPEDVKSLLADPGGGPGVVGREIAHFKGDVHKLSFAGGQLPRLREACQHLEGLVQLPGGL